MSFTGRVKTELVKCLSDRDREFACLCGMLLFSQTLTDRKIVFRTHSRTSAGVFPELFGKIFGCEPLRRQSDGENSSVYSFEICDTELVGRVFRTYGFYDFSPDMFSTGSLGAFLGGIFLACGSVSDPEKEYHLEYCCVRESLCSLLIGLLKSIGVSAGEAVRRGQHIVYIKGSTGIEDNLTFMGATQCTLEIMNIKIYKDVRNKVNRIANCDSANIDKAISASARQTEDIRLIEETKGLDTLPPQLREVAILRLENPFVSLREIGQRLPEPIGRCGVSRRFGKIADIACRIREEKKRKS